MIKKVDPIYHIRDDPNAKTFQQPPHKQKRGILKKQQNITDLHSHGHLLIKIKNTAITKHQNQTTRTYFGERNSKPPYYIGNCSNHQRLQCQESPITPRIHRFSLKC